MLHQWRVPGPTPGIRQLAGQDSVIQNGIIKTKGGKSYRGSTGRGEDARSAAWHSSPVINKDMNLTLRVGGVDGMKATWAPAQQADKGKEASAWPGSCSSPCSPTAPAPVGT